MIKTIEEAIHSIESGKVCIIAGDESALTQLPKGNWIGGTIPYFMGDDGGFSAKDKVYLAELPVEPDDIKLRFYNKDNLKYLTTDYPEHGFTYFIIPGLTEIHHFFATESHRLKNLMRTPLVGWITGVNVDDIGEHPPKVFDGLSLRSSTSSALAMHIPLPENIFANIEILNIFEQGQGDVIEFEEKGFSAKNAVINGKTIEFHEYLTENKIDTKFPLIADYHGALINVSIQETAAGETKFFAPVVPGIKYRFAKPLVDYHGDFIQECEKQDLSNVVPIFSCNCILNYLYAELEQIKTGFPGPMTFGEIAYILLNQTMVYLTLNRVNNN